MYYSPAPITHLSYLSPSLKETWFYQAMLQLTETPSDRLCVPMARGGDPQFSFNVKMRGVEGTSGSFRHFLNRVTEELHSQVLSLFLPYIGILSESFPSLYSRLSVRKEMRSVNRSIG